MANKPNAVELTIKPLAAYLHHIATTLPPKFTTYTAFELEKLYKRLDIEQVALGLDGRGMSESSRELKEKTDKLLVMLRKWENKGRKLGVHNVETLEALQDTDYDGYWGLRQDYDEVADTAASVSSWLIVLANQVQAKQDDGKAGLGPWATAQALAPHTKYADKPGSLETALTRWAKKDPSIRREVGGGGGKGGAKYEYITNRVLSRYGRP